MPATDLVRRSDFLLRRSSTIATLRSGGTRKWGRMDPSRAGGVSRLAGRTSATTEWIQSVAILVAQATAALQTGSIVTAAPLR